MSRRAVAAVVVASTAAGLYFASQVRLAYPDIVRTTWAYALTVNLVFYWLWGAVVPLVVALARRFPLDARSWRRSLPAHLVLGAAVTLVQIVASKVIVGALLGWSSGALDSIAGSVRVNFHSSYPTYWVILLGATAWRAASLQARLAEARLLALRAQLQPHFLFNALNSVSALMYRDVEAADAMIASLSDLLRTTLRADDRQEIPLREELELTGRYLAIERFRFEDRLRLGIDVAADVEGALVPPFVLQPLVENAIHHAIAPRPEGGRVDIRARRRGGELVVEVVDDGPGLPAAAPAGVGIDNTRARLAELHGAAARLELSGAPDGGTTVTLTLPLRS